MSDQIPKPIVYAGLLVIGFTLGAFVFQQPALPPPPIKQPPPQPAKQELSVNPELQLLGKWQEVLPRNIWTFDFRRGLLVMNGPQGDSHCTYQIDTSKTPHRIQWKGGFFAAEEDHNFGIFEVTADKLRLCFFAGDDESKRPTRFTQSDDPTFHTFLFEFKRSN